MFLRITQRTVSHITRITSNLNYFLAKNKRKIQKRVFLTKKHFSSNFKKKRFFNFKHYKFKLFSKYLRKKNYTKFKIINFKNNQLLSNNLQIKLNNLKDLNLKLNRIKKFKILLKKLKLKKQKILLLKLLLRKRKVYLQQKKKILKYLLFKNYEIKVFKKKVNSFFKLKKKLKYKLKLIKYQIIQKKKNNLISLKKKFFIYNLRKFKKLKFKRFQKASLHLFKFNFLIKQKLMRFYNGVDFKNLFKLVKKYYPYGNQKYKKFIFSFLETRIDIILTRMGVVNSIYEAQQLISHGFVSINNKPIYSKNYFLKPGEIIKINHHFQNPKKNLIKLKLKNFFMTKLNNKSLLIMEFKENKDLFLNKKFNELNLESLEKIIEELKKNFNIINLLLKLKTIYFKLKKNSNNKKQLLLINNNLKFYFPQYYNLKNKLNKELKKFFLLNKKLIKFNKYKVPFYISKKLKIFNREIFKRFNIFSKINNININNRQYLISAVNIFKNNSKIKYLIKNLQLLNKYFIHLNKEKTLLNNYEKLITQLFKKQNKKNILNIFNTLKNSKIKPVIISRPIKSKLFLLKIKLKKKLYFSYLNLLTYLWLNFKSQNIKFNSKIDKPSSNFNLTLLNFIKNKNLFLKQKDLKNKLKFKLINNFNLLNNLKEEEILKINNKLNNLLLIFAKNKYEILLLSQLNEIKRIQNFIKLKKKKFKTIQIQFFKYGSIKKKFNKNIVISNNIILSKNKKIKQKFKYNKNSFKFIKFLKRKLKQKQFNLDKKLKVLKKININLNKKLFKYPKYLQINFKTKSAILLHYPKINQIPLPFSIKNKLKSI